MTEIFTCLPPEIFCLVTEQLSKADLKALSRSSRHLHAAVASALWETIVIRSPREDALHCNDGAGFPQVGLRLARQLHFRSASQHVAENRCPHFQDPPSEDNESELNTWCYRGDEESSDEAPFTLLSKSAMSLLRQLSDGQLYGFGWDLGSCVPSEILGPDGILPRQHSSLRSLSLTSDCTCETEFVDEIQIDLSAFRQLQSLSWKGPTPLNLEVLSTAIRQNAAHLQKLELDYVSWSKIRHFIVFHEHAISPNGVMNHFASVVLRLDEYSPRPLLPKLRVLSLSQVPLTPYLTTAINWGTLKSLTLRKCPGWQQFLTSVAELGVPMKLQTFEIHLFDVVAPTPQGSASVLSQFLDSFDGLEELFVSHAGPVGVLELWEIIARRHGTLRKFVHHQRGQNLMRGVMFRSDYDLPDLGMGEQETRRIEENLSHIRLGTLDLEFLGLSCSPAHLKSILLPFTEKTSLKVLHIRRSSRDLAQTRDWALLLRSSPATLRELAAVYVGSGNLLSGRFTGETAAAGEGVDEVRNGGMRDELRKFLDWVFGAEGIASLQVVAFGDFSYGGRAAERNLVLFRVGGGGTFRVVEQHGAEWVCALEQHRDAFEACPVDNLLHV